MTDLEWKVRNWYNFTWLSGDGLVEQAVHTVDWLAWTMKDEPARQLHGGRRPADPGERRQHLRPHRGQLPLGTRGTRLPRPAPDHRLLQRERPLRASATKGTAKITGRRRVDHGRERLEVRRPEATTCTRPSTTSSSLSIRDGKPLNDGDRMGNSTLMAIMGRMAVHRPAGEVGDVANSKESIVWNHGLEYAGGDRRTRCSELFSCVFSRKNERRRRFTVERLCRWSRWIGEIYASGVGGSRRRRI